MVPPAPFAVVRFSPTMGGPASDLVTAKVDSGADRTVIPALFVRQLGLAQSGTTFVAGLGGEIEEAPIYDVRLVIGELEPLLTEVLAHPGEEWALLGRDVLNRYRVIFDGPKQQLEII